MTEVVVATDGGADLSREPERELGLVVVRRRLTFNGVAYERGDDGALHKLGPARRLPSPDPLIGRFVKVYGEAAARGRPLVSIHGSGALDPAGHAARVARNLIGAPRDVLVFEVPAGSRDVAFVAEAAAQVARTGATLAQIEAFLLRLRASLRWFVISWRTAALPILNPPRGLRLRALLTRRPPVLAFDSAVRGLVVEASGIDNATLSRLTNRGGPTGDSELIVRHARAEGYARAAAGRLQQLAAFGASRVERAGPGAIDLLGERFVEIAITPTPNEVARITRWATSPAWASAGSAAAGRTSR